MALMLIWGDDQIADEKALQVYIGLYLTYQSNGFGVTILEKLYIVLNLSG